MTAMGGLGMTEKRNSWWSKLSNTLIITRWVMMLSGRKQTTLRYLRCVGLPPKVIKVINEDGGGNLSLLESMRI
jgi:hypothetical protein